MPDGSTVSNYSQVGSHTFLDGVRNALQNGCVGDGTTNDRAALNTLANTTLQPNGGTIFFGAPYTYRISSDITFPSNVKLEFAQGAVLTVDAAKTVTVQGLIEGSVSLAALNVGAGTVGISGEYRTADHQKVKGTDSSFEVMNAAATQNWYFGVDDSDGNKLKIGRGYGPAQGITPAITISPGSGIIAIGDPTHVTTAMFTITSNDDYGQDDNVFWYRRYGTGTSESIIVHQHINPTGTPQPIFCGMSGRGSLASPVALHSSDILLILDGRGFDGSSNNYGQYAVGWTDTQAAMFLRTSQAWTGTAHGTKIEFYTTANDTTSVRVVGYIDQDGSLVIGESAASFQNGIVITPGAISGIGSVAVPDLGTGGGPSLTFILDTDTGLKRVSTNSIGFLTGGSEAVRIDSAQAVSIGSAAAANTKSILDLTSTTRGMLPPRMTTTQRDAISSPPEGLVLYNTTTHKINYRDNSTWVAL